MQTSVKWFLCCSVAVWIFATIFGSYNLLTCNTRAGVESGVVEHSMTQKTTTLVILHRKDSKEYICELNVNKSFKYTPAVKIYFDYLRPSQCCFELQGHYYVGILMFGIDIIVFMMLLFLCMCRCCFSEFFRSQPRVNVHPVHSIQQNEVTTDMHEQNNIPLETVSVNNASSSKEENSINNMMLGYSDASGKQVQQVVVVVQP